MILNDRQIIELAEQGMITPFRRCVVMNGWAVSKMTQ